MLVALRQVRSHSKDEDQPFICGVTTQLTSAPYWISKLMKMSDSALKPKSILLKIWKVVTWRWRLQLAINAPFGVLWIADKTNPAVHAFDMSILAAIHAEWMAPMMGIG